MTFGASGDWDVGFKAPHCRCDIDMTSRALRDVLLLVATAFVDELERIAQWHTARDERSRSELVTALAIGSEGFLRFPVTVETGRVIGWSCFERPSRRDVCVRPAVRGRL